MVFLIRGGKSGAPVSIKGVSIHRILTGSMEPELPQGSLIVTYRMDPQKLEIGDDITYMKDAETSITHKIVGIVEQYEETGERAFITQGITNSEPDKDPVPAVNVVGKVIFHSKFLEKLAWILSQTWYFWILSGVLMKGIGKAIAVLVQKNEKTK